MNALSHKQVVSLIKSVGTKRTVLVQGEAGSGKTSIHYELASDPAFANYIAPAPVDCTQLSDGSIWMPDIDRERMVSRELPNERFGMHMANQYGINGSRPVLICLDEIAKAKQYVKDAIAPILYERRVGEYRAADGSIIFACTNLGLEGLGDSLQAHLRDRLVIVTMRKPTQLEWQDEFAIPRGLHESVIGCVKEFPMVFESFADYEEDANKRKNLSATNPYIFNPRGTNDDKWVTPRSLHAASDLVHSQASMDEYTLTHALDGTVGRAFTQRLMGYIRFGNDLPDYQRIIKDPAGAPLPKNPTAQIVLVFKLITNVANHEEAAAITEYVLRLRAEMQTLFTTTVSSNTTKVAHFLRVKQFTQDLMLENRKFFTA